MKKPAKNVPNLQIKRARESQGWSQEYVAREVGTDAFTVSRWERGITVPSPHFRQQLCSLFGLSAAELGLVPTEQNEPFTQVVSRPEAISSLPVVILDPAIPPSLTIEHALVGRDELLRQLKARLLNGGRVALSALNGLPGVGKTALATTLAHDEEVRAHFSGGILWAGLGTEPDVLGLLSRWGTLLNCAPPDMAQRSHLETWATNIHAAIGQRRMLLVIDDAWEFAHARAFQVGGPHCAYLLTTRFPEIARRFATEGATVVRELADTEGRMLLMRLAPEMVQVEPEEAHALVAAVGGLPLALTLLGNYLRAQSHSGQPRRLRAALERLHRTDERLRLAEPQALVGGHPSLSVGTPLSLQAVIGISDQQVSAEARSTLRALSVFPPKPNTFSEQAALAVSALPVETLDELADAGLLENSGQERYTLHQTIADYARANLADPEAFERLVAYFVAYVEAHTNDNPALDRESNNILAALEAAHEQGMQSELVRGVHAFASFLETRGLYAVAEVHVQRALEAARSLEDTAGQATAWLHLGRIMEQRGDYASARERWHNGLVLARRYGHDGQIAGILMELGILSREQGQPEQARQFFEEALIVSRRSGSRRDEGSILRNLGILAREQGLPEQARQLYEEALAVSREIGDRREVARTLNNLGVLARQHGRPEQARQLLEEAISIFQELEDRRGAAVSMGNLARIAENQGHPSQARQLYEEALAVFRQLGDRRSAAQVLHNVGTIAWGQGESRQARRLYEEALNIFSQLGDRRTAALTLGELGVLAREQGELDQAGQFLEQAIVTFRQLANRREEIITLREQGALARLQGQYDRAQQFLHEALDALLQLQDQREAAFAQRELGILAREQEQYEQARQFLEQALSMFHRLEDRHEEGRTLKELGILVREQEQFERSRQFLDQALTMLREVGDRREVARTLLQMGMLSWQRRQGDYEEALPLLLSARVGLKLVDSPELRVAEEAIEQARVQVGEAIFGNVLRYVAREAPEPAYGLNRAEWGAAIRKQITKMLVI
jgi:tetratricopeptide (TPR) repeat protein/transcriptional regulator with XRE-family HTH domain